MAETEETASETEGTETASTTDAAALAAEVEKWKTLSRQNEKNLRAAQAELEKSRQSSMSETEKAVAAARAEGRSEAMQATTERLLKAEVRALAAGILADPADAVHLLDLSGYTPGEDGEFDRRQIRSDLVALVKAKPYLSPKPGAGSGEGGPRGGAAAKEFSGDDWLRGLAKR